MDEPTNPYLPPISDIEILDNNEPRKIIMVGSGTRFLNHLIDLIVGDIIITSIIVLLFLISKETAVKHLQGCIVNLYVLLFWITYYTILESIFSQSIGKMLTKTIVVDELGNKPKFKQILGRSLARCIPFEAFSFFGKESRGWHDSLAKTYVIKRRSA